MTIRFGTDGWRAKMGKEFTFANVRRVCQAYANFLKKTIKARDIGILVNHDTRYLSADFAAEAARILSLNRIRVLLPDHDAPVPAASLAIVQNRLQGGMAFTASYNDLTYNGIKLYDSKGSPLLPSRTVLIEEEISRVGNGYSFQPRYVDERMLETVEVKTPYLEYLAGVVDFAKIRHSGLHIIVDNLYGTSRDYLDKIFMENGVAITPIHNYSDTQFGGVLPSCNRENLHELSGLVKDKKADLGLATDIDSDRFGVIDASGKFVDANTVLPPLIDYLISIRKMQGDIVKSISSTQQIDRVAHHYLRKVYETPVGFKYLADMLFTRRAFIGVESSNGAALKGPTAQKDGILFNLLIAEMMAHYQKPLQKILHDFHRRFPRLHNTEIMLRQNPQRHDRYQTLLAQKTLPQPHENLRGVQLIDGIKFLFKNSWLLIRESGTAPCMKIYAEAETAEEMRQLIKSGRSLLE